eukprot:CAMPEP_0115376348 /NCGR_PEP_ID=MMETSP0271-20121206/2932_1 /TAXON_ID=71861 /ORGANISM="Scrippsiella trochoidea, Strain CCMP3099" /LENGTH=87 /DNA_ID=CAMNT_0002799441 /DNA_START=44 /DNA_END=307 /DNA_ORIENTATION=+
MSPASEDDASKKKRSEVTTNPPSSTLYSNGAEKLASGYMVRFGSKPASISWVVFGLVGVTVAKATPDIVSISQTQYIVGHSMKMMAP